MKKLKIVKINNNEEPPTILVENGNGKIIEYTITEFNQILAGNNEGKEPQPFDRKGE